MNLWTKLKKHLSGIGLCLVEVLLIFALVSGQFRLVENSAVQYTYWELLFFLLLYSFVGWCAEVLVTAIWKRRFVNAGLLNLPFRLSYGIAALLLICALPTLEHNIIAQYLLTLIVLYAVLELSRRFAHLATRRTGLEDKVENVRRGKNEVWFIPALAGVYLILYLTVQPVLFALVRLIPNWLVMTVSLMLTVLIVLDSLGMMRVLHRAEAPSNALGKRFYALIWRRLHKAYPGIGESADPQADYTFAKGMGFDKLVWVFLLSSFIGALVEMAFCRVTGGVWMNRSSLAYGTFSVVWGLGAVILTVVLQRFENKPDRVIFLGGFILGGAYEYLCSVFTEIVFGTVFWDYSHIPLNINGRVNVLYCIFWGILAVVWLRVLYPPMERVIEKLPPLLGKVLTWALVLIIACDGLLTAAAMIRYTERKSDPVADNAIETFLDKTYDDTWMENRWPNMCIPGSAEAAAAE